VSRLLPIGGAEALKARNFGQCMPVMPAMMPLGWHRPSMDRAMVTTLPSWRSKKPVALSGRRARRAIASGPTRRLMNAEAA
jgi:hypothetical protein